MRVPSVPFDHFLFSWHYLSSFSFFEIDWKMGSDSPLFLAKASQWPDVFPALHVGLYMWLAFISGRGRESPKPSHEFSDGHLVPLLSPWEELSWMAPGGWEAGENPSSLDLQWEESHSSHCSLTGDTQLRPVHMSRPPPNLLIHELTVVCYWDFMLHWCNNS